MQIQVTSIFVYLVNNLLNLLAFPGSHRYCGTYWDIFLILYPFLSRDSELARSDVSSNPFDIYYEHENFSDNYAEKNILFRQNIIFYITLHVSSKQSIFMDLVKAITYQLFRFKNFCDGDKWCVKPLNWKLSVHIVAHVFIIVLKNLHYLEGASLVMTVAMVAFDPGSWPLGFKNISIWPTRF